MKKVYKIEVDCAVCAQKIEEAIKKIEGVNAIQVNFITQKMILDAKDLEFEAVYKKAVSVAKKIEPDFDVIGWLWKKSKRKN